MATSGFSPEAREQNFKQTGQDLENRPWYQNMGISAAKMAPFGGALGALGGGLAGLVGGRNPDFSTNWGHVGLGALAGGAGGAAAGALGGGISGGVNSLSASMSSPESKDRAATMKANHPFATALPLGDLIGSAKA